ncbi:MAG: Fe-S cluster assembly protein IscX [Nitrospirae bacterium]|nr:Fe-S cluster assembly protein IscX [Nitrospirota bacterium]
MKLSWQNPEDIALALIDRYPDKDPLTLRFTDLREMVVGLPDFGDDPAKSTEGKLEAIQMAWYQEWQDVG